MDEYSNFIFVSLLAGAAAPSFLPGSDIPSLEKPVW